MDHPRRKSLRASPLALPFAGAAMALGLASAAAAHPHVLVDARAEIVVEAGKITAIRNIWRFDPDFSAYAIEGLDANGDGAYSTEELQPLAQVNVESLAEFGFFTFLDSLPASVAPPAEYWLTHADSQLTLFFTLPLAEPRAAAGAMEIEIYDPEFFVAFAFPSDSPATMAGDTGGCVASFQGPRALDPATQALLAAVPAGQPLPPDLAAAAVDLTNTITVRC